MPVDDSANNTKQVLILTNPRAGRRSRVATVSQLANRLTQLHFQVSVIDQLDALASRSAELLNSGRLHCIVAAGGDGTMTEVANRTVPGTPLVPLPLGTENLLAKYLGIRPQVDFLADLITTGRRVALDAGAAAGRIFLLMASCGYDAEVVHHLHHSRQGHIKHLTYAPPIWQAIRSYQYPELRVYCRTSDEQQVEDAFVARWVFLFNLPCYARGLGLAPLANGLDGQLDLCAFRRGSLARGLYYLAHVIRGTHVRLPDCIVRRVRQVRIEADVEVAWQFDGDPGGWLPLEVKTVPGRLTLLVPSTWHGAPPAC